MSQQWSWNMTNSTHRPDDFRVIQSLQRILETSDLTKLTRKEVRKQLEHELGGSFSSPQWKTRIKQEIEEFVTRKQDNNYIPKSIVSKHISFQQSIERKINHYHLFNGYIRENSTISFMAKSVIELISHFYPSMNGHTFIFKINNQHLLNGNDTIDSDIFDIGLENKFFLRLYTNFNGFQSKNSSIERSASHCNNILLSLMSFQLPSHYHRQIFHCELYCPQLNVEYSQIWRCPSDQMCFAANNNNNGQISIIDHNYLQNRWVIHHDLSKKTQYELTFECKINILCLDINSHYEQDQDHSYKYIASPIINGNKMKFIWDVIDNKMVDALLTDNGRTAIQYHSDIYYDMFQLQFGRENNNHFFKIQICGFPKDTNKMVVQLKLYVIDINNENYKVNILSNIITFSYNQPLYMLSNEKTDILSDLLIQCKKLRILCIANIIEKYDESGDIVKKDDNQEIVVKRDQNDNDNDDDNDEEEWLSTTDQLNGFIWSVDPKILNEMKTAQKNPKIFHSKVFKILGYKWCVEIYSTTIEEMNGDLLYIAPNCILHDGWTNCEIYVEIKETKNENKYYEKYLWSNWSGGYWARSNESEKIGARCLLLNRADIQKLDTLNIKVEISIIDEYQKQVQKNNTGWNQDGSEQKDDKNNSVEIWLRDEVGLPQYYHIFCNENIKDMETLKLVILRNSWQIAEKINKLGDSAKMLQHLHKLIPSQRRSRSRSPSPFYNRISSMDEEIKESVDDDHDNPVEIWLRDVVGLSEYYNLFKKECINDMETLKLMEESHWKEFSCKINKIGHLAKIEHHIKKLNPSGFKQNNMESLIHLTQKYWIIAIYILVIIASVLYRSLGF